MLICTCSCEDKDPNFLITALQSISGPSGNIHKTQYGCLLWTSAVPTYPSEDACIIPAGGGGVHLEIVDHIPVTCAWVSIPSTVEVKTMVLKDGT
jgi:hypothetical protein